MTLLFSIANCFELKCAVMKAQAWGPMATQHYHTITLSNYHTITLYSSTPLQHYNNITAVPIALCLSVP
jgi:hypothetical protein